LLVVHRAGQAHIKGLPDVALPPLSQLIGAVEALAALARPATAWAPAPKVRAIALNTALLEPPAAQAAIAQCEKETGLPCADVVREGPPGSDRLLSAFL
jgi:uncharacterized NAD-dependent epimerase/dehydratase family protein